MKKIEVYKITLTLVMIFSAFETRGQFNFGIKGSYSLPFNTKQEIKYDDSQDFLIYRVNFLELDVSPTIALVGYYRNDLVYFQLELAYKRVRSRFLADNYVDLENITQTENVKQTHSLDFPLMAGIRIDHFKLGVGPTFSFIISENPIFQDVDLFEERRSSTEIGFGFTAGIVLYRLHVEMSYQYKFNGVGDYLYWRQDYRGFSQPVQFIELSMGIFLYQFS